MSWQAYVAFAAGSVGAAAFVLRLVRRGELRGKYSLLWLGAVAALVVIALVPGLLDWTADRLGVGYAPAILFAVAFVFLLLVLVHLSWELTRLEDRTRILAEALALLRADGEARHDPTARPDLATDQGPPDQGIDQGIDQDVDRGIGQDVDASGP